MCSIALCVLVPALRAVSFHYGYTAGLASYTWFVADGLAAGSLLAIVLRTAITRQQVISLCTALLVGGAMLAVVGRPFGILTRDRLLGAALQHTVIDIVFGGILLLVLLVGTSTRKGYVNHPVLRFLGYLSYGLYLIHLLAFRMYDRLSRNFWPQLQPSDGHFGLVVLRFFIAGGFAIGLAYLSRTYFEERFLQLKDRLTPAPATELAFPATEPPSGTPPQEIPA
jgi:peptidoglycan/LPS O-acetylase OafA/YrhL